MIDMIVISNNQYSALCWLAGAGWGLFIATLSAAIIIDRIKWYRWVMGK